MMSRISNRKTDIGHIVRSGELLKLATEGHKEKTTGEMNGLIGLTERRMKI